MYRHYIFCSGSLGINAHLEAFPIGCTLAFDSHKGRLWAVCPTCGRWNLAPLEERWEAVESAERLFRTVRCRVQSANVGLADLPDGTRLVRIGAALPHEFAAWRYSRQLRSRRRRYAALAGGSVAVGALAISGTPAAFLALPAAYGWILQDALAQQRRARRVLCRADSQGVIPLTRGSVVGAVLNGSCSGEVALCLQLRRRGRREWSTVRVLEGQAARRVLARLLVDVNPWGANPAALEGALELITRSGSSEDYLKSLAAQTFTLELPGVESSLHLDRYVRLARALQKGSRPEVAPLHSLALEIALHEEAERCALKGELAELRIRWQEAEEIAEIADTLLIPPAVKKAFARYRKSLSPTNLTNR